MDLNQDDKETILASSSESEEEDRRGHKKYKKEKNSKLIQIKINYQKKEVEKEVEADRKIKEENYILQTRGLLLYNNTIDRLGKIIKEEKIELKSMTNIKIKIKKIEIIEEMMMMKNINGIMKGP